MLAHCRLAVKRHREHPIFVIPLTPNPSPTRGEGRILYFSPLSHKGRGVPWGVRVTIFAKMGCSLEMLGAMKKNPVTLTKPGF
jgi:hypothetical protein